MSYKDLYSEVKKMKQQGSKKDVVKAVEKHGRILAVEGRFEKPKKVINNMYGQVRLTIKPDQVPKYDLSDYDLVLLGCPADKIPESTHPKIRAFVENGGWLLTTDWAIVPIVEKIFPGYIRWNGQKTADAVVACQIDEPDHPFLDGVKKEIQKSEWSKKSSKNTAKDEFRWWLENKSYPIQVLNPGVSVLISSNELQYKWGDSPVLVYFDYGKMGGRVIHMISHTHLQKGGEKGKFASAMILTNILDEKISVKMGIKKAPTPAYVSNRDQLQGQPQQQYSQPSVEDQWLSPPGQDNFVTPSAPSGGIGLTGTAQIVDVDPTSFSRANKCAYCGFDFSDITGKILMCKECKAPYHEDCLNHQIQEGACKTCNRILLW